MLNSFPHRTCREVSFLLASMLTSTDVLKISVSRVRYIKPKKNQFIVDSEGEEDKEKEFEEPRWDGEVTTL